MNVFTLVACSVLLVMVWLVLRVQRAHGLFLHDKIRIIESALGDITGRQMRLADEYRDVHAILKQIRDLNTAELTERKEILQHQNITAANRVVQARRWISDLEEAARKELDGLKHG